MKNENINIYKVLYSIAHTLIDIENMLDCINETLKVR